MRKEYDFKKGKRGAIVMTSPGQNADYDSAG